MNLPASNTMNHAERTPDLNEIRAAAERIAAYATRTPIMRSRSLDALAGCELLFKCEHLQRVGAFKFRGACNAVFSLTDDEAARGVVTQSSGNHGAAIALACRLRGIAATVVVPGGAPKVKLAAIRAYGGEVMLCETSQASRDAVTRELLAERGGCYVHPFNDARVIAGQATATLELLEQAAGLDLIVAPVSGGGLMSGTALAAHALNPAIICVGAEPEGARDAHDSLATGERVTGRPTHTICDGLRAELSPLTFGILRKHLAGIVLVDEAQVVAAMRLVWERLKQVIEPSAAVPLAAVLADPQRFAGRRVGLILSGGNVDLDALPWH